MNWLKLKSDKSRFITSIFILLFYLLYFFIGSITFEWSDQKDIWIANIVFFIINIALLLLINFEILKLFNFNDKKFLFLQFFSYLSIILMYLMPFAMEIGDYVPYKEIHNGLGWIHVWFAPLYFFLFFLLFSLFAVISKNISFKPIFLLYLLTLLVAVSFKTITIIMLHSAYGWTSLLFLFLIVIFTDTFSYLGGTLFGKHKLATKLSPNKTVEGFISGIIMGSILALIFCLTLYACLPTAELKYEYAPFLKMMPNNEVVIYVIYVIFTFILSFFSQLGDLLFSLIKRKFNVKDFSNLLPGHGGFLDRVDSLVIVSLFAFLFTQLIQNI